MHKLTPIRFCSNVQESHQLREGRRLTEEEFMAMAKDPDTIVLDARSSDRYQQMHIEGAKSLSFTDFTEETLAEVIPSKDTRILIYCNNNIENSPIAFAAKMAPASSKSIHLHIAIYLRLQKRL